MRRKDIEPDLKKILRWEYLIVLLIMISFFILDFYPKLRDARQLKTKWEPVKMKRKMLSQSERETQQKTLQEEQRRIQEDLRLIRQAVGEVQGRVSQDQNIPLVTLEIEDLAASSQIELSSIKPLTARQEGGYEVVPIEIEFQSDYPQLINFLSQLENCSVWIALEGLSIRKDDLIYPALDIRLTLCILTDAGKESGNLDISRKL